MNLPGHVAPLEYHRGLLDDPTRIDVYDRAIRALVRPGDVVLDLGTGTGILAMLAARAGAARVHAVESMGVAGLARALVRANGLEDVVRVHEVDFRSLDPIEPVDLVVSDFMGRFLVDDGMLAAVEATGAWLKPWGRLCPARVQLQVAPVGDFPLRQLERFQAPLLGLDLRPVREAALNSAYAVSLPAEAVMAEPVAYHMLRPPAPAGSFDGTLRFTIARDGVLKGLAGWFDAALTHDIALTTRPGRDTHWGQYLFPLPATRVRAGDHVEARLWLRGSAWVWRGQVRRGPTVRREFSLSAVPSYRAGEPDEPVTGWGRAEIYRASQAAAAAVRKGKPVHAVRLYEAAVRAIGPDEADLLPVLNEALGLAYLRAGQHQDAVGAFLRALDGQPTSREASLRHLVTQLARSGSHLDSRHYLALYEATFGRHPDVLRAGESA